MQTPLWTDFLKIMYSVDGKQKYVNKFRKFFFSEDCTGKGIEEAVE
jgi:hypothetical protein